MFLFVIISKDQPQICLFNLARPRRTSRVIVNAGVELVFWSRSLACSTTTPMVFGTGHLPGFLIAPSAANTTGNTATVSQFASPRLASPPSPLYNQRVASARPDLSTVHHTYHSPLRHCCSLLVVRPASLDSSIYPHHK